MTACIWGTLGVLFAAWLTGYTLMTGGLPHVRIWRPDRIIPPRALRRLERRYDAAVHWLTRGPAPHHAQPRTEPFRKVSA